MPKWKVLELIETEAPQCLAVVDRCFEDYWDLAKKRDWDWVATAIEFCRK